MRLSGPGATTFKLTVTESRQVDLEDIVSVDALDTSRMRKFLRRLVFSREYIYAMARRYSARMRLVNFPRRSSWRTHASSSAL